MLYCMIQLCLYLWYELIMPDRDAIGELVNYVVRLLTVHNKSFKALAIYTLYKAGFIGKRFNMCTQCEI